MKGINKNVRTLVTLKSKFTQEEIKLIQQYCDERIYELKVNNGIYVDPNYIKLKQKIKKQVAKNEYFGALMFEDIKDMVWNREFLDHRHNLLNITILKKMEDTEYSEIKSKEYEETITKMKEYDKVKYKKINFNKQEYQHQYYLKHKEELNRKRYVRMKKV